MALTPENLRENGYEFHDKLDHSDLITFIQKSMVHKTLYLKTYYAINFIFFALLIAKVTYDTMNGVSFMQSLTYLGYGVLMALVLIPVHEWLHGMAYRMAGAKKITYEANWKKLYFMAIADGFVARHNVFLGVALTPFIIISFGAFGAAYLLPEPWVNTALALAFVHTVFCSGDFGLINYMSSLRKRGVVTYDDFANRITYFYVKK